jgi:hypothetical protein
MTLGELDRTRFTKVVAKEALVISNGALVGLSAALGDVLAHLKEMQMHSRWLL